MKYVWLIVFTISCTTVHRPPVVTHQQTLARIAKDRIAWADTIPIVRFNPPWVYAAWKAQMESCLGVTKEGWPKFYIAPINPLGLDSRGYPIVARFVGQADAVVFALGMEAMGWVVKHELAHWLMHPKPTHEHQPDLFSSDPTIGRCAAFLQEG